MSTLIIYTSSTGFTKRYAEWISKEVNGNAITLKEAKKKDKEYFEKYDNIIYGGWAMAGKVSKLDWFKNKISMWNDKKLAVFCVGASPIENPEVSVSLDKIFKDELNSSAKIFYCQGGLNYEKMRMPMKIMMKMFASSLAKKKDATESEKLQAEMLAKSYDISDKKYIKPIIEYLSE